MNGIELILIVAAMGLVIYLNILWYNLKKILQDKGYTARFFYGYLKDLDDLNDLIRNENDQTQISRYRKLRSRLLIGFFLFICLVFALMTLMTTH